MEKYRLEITMESRASWAHKYIKRSFPVGQGTLDIGKYGYPYDRYKTVEIGEIYGRFLYGNVSEPTLKLNFDGEDIEVPINGFTTVKREYREVYHPYSKEPHPEEIYTTFYLYIE